MAQFLKDRHSSNVHQNIVRRCMRLCRQVKNAEEFAIMLEPLYNEFLQKRLNREKAEETREDLYDTKILKDTFLDDRLRDLYEDCKKYERNHPGSNIAALLFPDGLTAIVRSPLDLEPENVQRLILKIKELGSGHEFASHIPVLQAATEDSKVAIAAHAGAVNNFKTAQTLVTIAKSNLNQKYEKVIYAANSKFGKTYADRLFPSIQPSNKKGKPGSEAENEE